MVYIKKKDVEYLKDMANYITEPKYAFFRGVLLKIVGNLEEQRIEQNKKQKIYSRLKKEKGNVYGKNKNYK